MPLTTDQKKRFRKIGHQLKPVVTIADKGFSETVQHELNRALEDHELIKIKLPAMDSSERNELIAVIGQHAAAEVVQRIGRIALLYRAARKPDPRLSNLLRFQVINQ
jgi:RNA-binding protein